MGLEDFINKEAEQKQRMGWKETLSKRGEREYEENGETKIKKRRKKDRWGDSTFVWFLISFTCTICPVPLTNNHEAINNGGNSKHNYGPGLLRDSLSTVVPHTHEGARHVEDGSRSGPTTVDRKSPIHREVGQKLFHG